MAVSGEAICLIQITAVLARRTIKARSGDACCSTEDIEGGLSDRARAASMHSSGLLAIRREDLPRAEQHFKDSRAIFNQLNDERHLAGNAHQLGVVAHLQGDLDVAEKWYLESLSV